MEEAVKPKYHVYIPSKGRASNCLTAKLMQEDSIPFSVVVEPNEYEAYASFFDEENLLCLPKNGQGLPYSRNKIKSYSKSQGEVCHWQMDDDIRKFMKREDGKNVKVSAIQSILDTEAIFHSYKNLSMLAHRYTSFAFSYSAEFSFNQNPCTSILVRNSVPANWRKGTVDDADFALQVLTSGGTTLITNRHLIDTLPHMKQSGGLTDFELAGDGRHGRFIQLVKDWPGSFSIGQDKKGNAKLRHKRIWSSFPQRPVEK